MERLFHGAPPTEADLRSRRGVDQRGKVVKHAVSRHMPTKEVTHPDGNVFGKGTPFPAHVRPGDITFIEKHVAREFQLWKRNLNSQIVDAQECGGAFRVRVALYKFGVGHIGAFVRNGSVCTVFPDDE